MIYVMECGPIFHRSRECWLAFSVDTNSRQVKSRVMQRRDDARREVALELKDARASCCASLAEFGSQYGWRVEPVPETVHSLAAQTLVGLVNQETLGPLAFSAAGEVWLRACAIFVGAAPWQQFNTNTPLSVTFSNDPGSTRVLLVGGTLGRPPSLSILPDLAAYERSRSQRGDDDGLGDAFILALDPRPGVVSEMVGLAFEEAFHPRVLRLEDGSPREMTEMELLQVAAALAAVASLASGRPIGRAVLAGLEAIVVPMMRETALRS